MDFSRVNISSNLLRKIVGYDPIQINIYGDVTNDSIICELKKLYPHIENEIDIVFDEKSIINKTIMGNPNQRLFSYDIITSR